MKLLACPYIGSKQLVGPICLGWVRSVLDPLLCLFWTGPKRFGPVPNGLDRPKRIGFVQNKLNRPKSFWNYRRTRPGIRHYTQYLS